MNADLTLREIADRLGLTRGRVQHFVADGRLRARRIGYQWVVRARDAEAFIAQRGAGPQRAGRPRKSAGAS